MHLILLIIIIIIIIIIFDADFNYIYRLMWATTCITHLLIWFFSTILSTRNKAFQSNPIESRFKVLSLECLVVKYLFSSEKRKISQNDDSLLLFVNRCLSLSLVVPLVVFHCHLLAFAVTRCITRCHWLCHSMYHSSLVSM